MDYRILPHARQRMQERRITESDLDAVMQNPQQIVPEKKGRNAYQALIIKDRRIVLLRIIVNDAVTPALVFSVYVTLDAIRYWRTDP